MLEKLTVNDVATGESRAYPDIQPVDYDLSPEAVFDGVKRAAEAMKGWRNIETTEGDDEWELSAEAVTSLFKFVDDVTIRVSESGLNGRTRVWMRSKSRVGRGDFGANAKRIRAFIRQLNRELG